MEDEVLEERYGDTDNKVSNTDDDWGNVTMMRICPRCGRLYSGHPAVSREDNRTPICEDCGAREALTGLGIGPEEQDRILDAIHRSQRRY